MQRERNSFSANAPGGRTTAGSQLELNAPFIRSMGMTATPDTAAVKKCRRDRSGPGISPAAEGLFRYVIKPCRQSFRQLTHNTHSLDLIRLVGLQAPSQCFSHM